MSIDSMFESLLPDYISRRKQDVAELQSALKEKDFTKIKHICHTIRGSAKTFGFPGLQNLCQKLENAALSQDLDACTRLMIELPNMESWSVA